jgi:hypothetical protein
MDALSIIDQLDCPKGLPRRALAIASERRQELAPLLIAEIQDFLLEDPNERVPSDALFFIFHLLGSWGKRQPIGRSQPYSGYRVTSSNGSWATQRPKPATA